MSEAQVTAKGIHWLAPCLAVASFIAGIVAAVGHDQFYLSLDGRRTSSQHEISAMGAKFSTQQFNLAVGNTLAVVFRSTMCITISVAFCQMFWKIVRQESNSERPPTLKRLDAAQSANSNIFNLFYMPIWLRHPLLYCVAAISWLIPIASIITPATLSVTGRLETHNASQLVPKVDFDNLGFVAGMSAVHGDGGSDIFQYRGPSVAARQVALAVAAQGSMLSIEPPAINSTWDLRFQGPSIRCTELADGEGSRLAIETSVYNHILDSERCNSPPLFLAWYPRRGEDGTIQIEPYSTDSGSSSTDDIFLDPESILYNDAPSISGRVNDTTFFMASFPALATPRHTPQTTSSFSCTFATSPDEYQSTRASPLGRFAENSTVLQCGLYNSTYDTRFKYVNGDQEIKVSLSDASTDHKVPFVTEVMGPKQGFNASCPKLNTLGLNAPQCVWDGGVLSQLSYQGALQAFTMLFTGNITFSDQRQRTERSRVRETVLINSEQLFHLSDYGVHAELGILQDLVGQPGWRRNLQKQIYDSESAEFSGFSGIREEDEASTGTPLGEMMEKLFQNIVVSFMTSPSLRTVTETTSARADVQIGTYLTIYYYSRHRLWLAYGCAISLTLIAIVFGWFAILSNRACHSNSFSTMLLAGHGAEFSTAVAQSDKSGSDPLPTYLEKATVKVFVTNRDETEAMLLKPMSSSTAAPNT